jgi:hypothetical protein
MSFQSMRHARAEVLLSQCQPRTLGVFTPKIDPNTRPALFAIRSRGLVSTWATTNSDQLRNMEPNANVIGCQKILFCTFLLYSYKTRRSLSKREEGSIRRNSNWRHFRQNTNSANDILTDLVCRNGTRPSRVYWEGSPL